MSIRIISGVMGGRRLQTVPGGATRPFLDQVRGAVFNILGDRVLDAEVWDLFAGTGANGIEALSRGAGRVVFVEKGAPALRTLRANISSLQMAEQGMRFEVMRADAWDPPCVAPRDGSDEPELPPDVIFFDPPYASVSEDPTRALARAAAVLQRGAAGATLVFHFPAGVLDTDDLGEVGRVDLRTWGRSAVAFVKKG